MEEIMNQENVVNEVADLVKTEVTVTDGTGKGIVIGVLTTAAVVAVVEFGKKLYHKVKDGRKKKDYIEAEIVPCSDEAEHEEK